MDRSKYPEATEVHSEHLIYTEETKIEAIKKYKRPRLIETWFLCSSGNCSGDPCEIFSSI